MLLGVDTLMLLKILRTLECLATHVTVMGLERCVHSDMRRDVVTFGTADITATPFASEAEVVCGLATDVIIAQMFIDHFRIVKDEATAVPLACNWVCLLIVVG